MRSLWSMRPDRIYTAIACVLGIWLILSTLLAPLPSMQYFSDSWEHLATIRELMTNPLHPTHPQINSVGTSRQFHPYALGLAWLASTFGLTPMQALGIGGVVTTVLLFLGIWLFADRYFRHEWGPLVVLVCLLALWGNPWVYTGFHNIRTLFYAISYPATFVLALTFIGAALLIDFLERPRAMRVLALGLMVAVMCITHPLQTSMAVGLYGLLALFHGNANWRHRIAVLAAIGAGLAITSLWPYFNPFNLVPIYTNNPGAGGHATFTNVPAMLALVGPAFIGLPAALILVQRKQHWPITIALAGVTVIFVVGSLLAITIIHRFLAPVMLYLQLATAAIILSWMPASQLAGNQQLPARVRVIVPLVLAALLGLQVSIAAVDFVRLFTERVLGKTFGHFPNKPVVRQFSEITSLLPANAVVMTHERLSSRILPAFKGKIVGWNDPLIPNGDARAAATNAFFTIGTSDEERRDLITKFGVTHAFIVTDEGARLMQADESDVDAKLVAAITRLGRVIYERDGMVLVEFR